MVIHQLVLLAIGTHPAVYLSIFQVQENTYEQAFVLSVIFSESIQIN